MASRLAIHQPRLVVAGSSAQIGRHVADALRQGYRAFVVSPRSAEACGATGVEPGSWFELDLTDREVVLDAFRRIGESGAVDLVLYVGAEASASTGAEDASRSLANVLAGCASVAPRRFLLARSELPAGEPDLARAAVERAEDEVLAAAKEEIPTASIRFAPRPRLVLTGASGFIGRHLLEALCEDFQVVALARSSPSYCGVAPHPNLAWMQIDLCDRAAVAGAFRRIREEGGADFVVHLAAYYDFTGEPHEDYQRTNVDALRSVLEECRQLRLRRFVFASSLAASEFPPSGIRLTEASPANGSHPYAVTKQRGEELLREFADVPSVVVRLAAIFSDWLEYPPLFVSFERWRSTAWDRGILGGKGHFAIPYLHVQDVRDFIVRLLGVQDELAPAEVLIASPDEPTSLRLLYERVACSDEGALPWSPVIPAPVCRVGMVARDLVGRAMGSRPFERPWMAGYIDRTMPVDARRTRGRLGWQPRERLRLERRLPLLLQNRDANPTEWQRRNQVVLLRNHSALHLQLHAQLERLEEEVLRRLAETPASASLPHDDWGGRVAYQHLRAAVRNRDSFGLANFCALLAERRFDQGWLAPEVDLELRALQECCLAALRVDGEAASLRPQLEELVSVQFLMSRDQVEERFEQLRLHPHRRVGGLS